MLGPAALEGERARPLWQDLMEGSVEMNQANTDPRRSYETPCLIRYGTLEELTQGAKNFSGVGDVISID